MRCADHLLKTMTALRCCIADCRCDSAPLVAMERYLQALRLNPDWSEEEKPWVVGRQPFGQIAIANSDAGASAYTDTAIDQAYRAISELRSGKA